MNDMFSFELTSILMTGRKRYGRFTTDRVVEIAFLAGTVLWVKIDIFQMIVHSDVNPVTIENSGCRKVAVNC